MPLALLRAYRFTKAPASRQIATEALAFLETVCFRNDRLTLVGNAGWHTREKKGADSDEQPTEEPQPMVMGQPVAEVEKAATRRPRAPRKKPPVGPDGAPMKRRAPRRKKPGTE